MITVQEILKGATLEDQPEETRANLAILVFRLNQVREKWGKPMTVTSGLRTMEHQLEIYRQKAVDKAWPFTDGVYDESKVPKQSKHLYGQAADIADADGSLKAWVKSNVALMEEVGFWFEDFSTTTTWVHFQVVPPKSGNRFFMP